MEIHREEDSKAVEQPEEIAMYFNWAREVGIYLNSNLAYPVQFSNKDYGIQAQSPVSAEEALLIVPSNLIFSLNLHIPFQLEEIFSAHPEYFSIKARDHEENRLITFLLFELAKGPGSFWFPYFNSIPTNIENLLDWEARELLELQDISILYDMNSRKKKRKAMIKELNSILKEYPHIFIVEDIEEEIINKCWKIIETRGFRKGLPNLSLIPIADLFNHRNCYQSYRYGNDNQWGRNYEENKSDSEDEDEAIIEDPPCLTLSSQKLHRLNFGIYDHLSGPMEKISKKIEAEAKKIDGKTFMKKLKAASREKEVKRKFDEERSSFRISVGSSECYEAGSQVCISYGKYSNRFLLTNYGFALKNNKYNYARIKFTLNQLLQPIQLEKLSKNYNGKMQMAFKIKKSKINLELICVLRGLLWDISCNRPKAFFYPCDPDLELSVMQKMKALLNQSLEQYATTFEYDEKLLEEVDGRQHYAILYRLGAKECIIENISLIDSAIKVIERLKETIPSEGLNKNTKFNPFSIDGKLYIGIDEFQNKIKEYLETYNY